MKLIGSTKDTEYYMEYPAKEECPMIFSYNRFAVIPHLCSECHRYIWLEPYRRAEVIKYDYFLKENICKGCLAKFIMEAKDD